MWNPFDLVPDVQRLTAIFSQATAPTFFLGAIAGFVSLMNSRLNDVMIRIRALNRIQPDDENRAPLRADITRLRHRAQYLSSGIRACLRSGICATILLAIIFVTEFTGLKYAYGAGVLFFVATGFLGFALYRFAQEVSVGIADSDEYE